MKREYAVLDKENNILFRTAGFVDTVDCQRIPLSDGAALLATPANDESETISSLRRELENARSANQSKEAFLSSMSHDIRTPMNAIVGMTALAQKYIDEKSRVQDALDKIETASGHLLSLINDVLDMSRINSGRLSIANDVFSLSDLLHDTITIIRPQMQSKQHTWRLETENIEAEQLYGDALRLRQIFVNIISNAIKYTHDGGLITIQLSERMDGERCHLIFECTDNGIGMSKDFLARIYEPFERVNNSTVSKIEGTGLGMSIVKRMIDAMQGSIAIDSEPGRGTCVRIEIPLAWNHLEIDSSSLSARRLLIIEADERLMELYQRFLGEFNLDFTIVSGASQALAAITEAGYEGRDYDAAIIGSGTGDGGNLFDIAEYLHRSSPNLVIILVSGHDWEDIEYRANRSGVSHFIPLPFFRKTLINALNQALLDTGEGAGQSAAPDLTGRNILLVEDNLINQLIAAEILSITNATVETVEDGAQAVERYTHSEPGYYNLILMDIQMPVMDGYAATRAIRSSGRSDAQTVPVFAMTANTFAEDIARARQAGMNGHIAKPIDINSLMQMLRHLP